MGTPSRRILVSIAILAVVAAAWSAMHRLLAPFPADDRPDGAYLRIAMALERDAPGDGFPYLEEEAQVACYTIRSYATLAAAAIASDYPEAERARELRRYQRLADAKDPREIWRRIAEDRGWLRRLRRDLSGVASVEGSADRATVVTVRGTRYSFRRRPNGIWGLTMFTAQLDAEARRLARDWELVRQAAADYRHAAEEKP